MCCAELIEVAGYVALNILANSLSGVAGTEVDFPAVGVDVGWEMGVEDFPYLEVLVFKSSEFTKELFDEVEADFDRVGCRINRLHGRSETHNAEGEQNEHSTLRHRECRWFRYFLS